MSASQRELLEHLVEADRADIWLDEGARDLPHWLSIRFGISEWKARRWVQAADALEHLPRLSEAFGSGVLGIDKVVELARFATPENETRLIPWARRVSLGAVRRKADLETRRPIQEVQEAEEGRFVHWWYAQDGARFGLEAELPAADGAIVERALGRLAAQIPVTPGEEDPNYADARRADALVALCSARIGEDPDADRATVVVHVRAGERVDVASADIEGGPVIHPETARRLLCEARVQIVSEDRAGNVLGVGRMSREPSAWMLRQLRHRDVGCTFPGCGSRRFAKAHHIRWWRHGGRTDLDNLVLVCTFHHKLVHEHGWAVARRNDGIVRWFLPSGDRYRAGPAPPDTASPPETADPRLALTAALG